MRRRGNQVSYNYGEVARALSLGTFDLEKTKCAFQVALDALRKAPMVLCSQQMRVLQQTPINELFNFNFSIYSNIAYSVFPV